MGEGGGASGIILLVSIGVLFVMMLARQIPLQLLGRAFGSIFRPLARVLRLGGRRQLQPSAFSNSAWAGLARAFRHRTATEIALGDDFAHEEKHLRRQGVLFRWVSVIVGYISVPPDLKKETAEEYFERGREFLNGRVPIDADPQNLYEDDEGAINANFFEVDRPMQYLLNEMRKTINANVRKLTVVFSTIIATVLIVNLLYNTGALFDFHNALGLSGNVGFGPFTITPQDFNQTGFAISTTLGGAFVMWIIYFVEYVPYQRNNFREMSNFITRYLARLNDHFRTASGEARSVTVGQETDAAKFSQQARKWHTNVLWISLRIFFIESNVRSTIFQMTRNSGYYLVFVPVVFLAVLAALNYVLTVETGFNAAARLADLGVIFALLFIAMMAVYVFFLSRAMTAIDEINQDEWIGFDSLSMEDVLGEIVGKYAEDVGYWKNRIGGSF